MTKPAVGQETAQAVLDQIRMHPETHDQSNWVSPCGTTRCVAGLAVAVHQMECRYEEIEDEGLRLLDLGESGEGFIPDDAYLLFYKTTDAEAVHALEYLAKGESIPWTVVGHTRSGND